MAYPIGVNAIAEVILRYTVNGQQCMGVFHYMCTSGSSSDGKTALTAMLTAINSSGGLLGSLVGNLGANVIIGTPSAQLIAPSRYRKVTVPQYTSSGGTAADCEAQQTAIAFTKQADISGHHGQGTYHHGGVPSSYMAGGYVSTLIYSPLNAISDSLKALVTASSLTWTPVIYNRAAPATSLLVTNAFFQTTLRTMKRRVVGRGI